MLSMAGVGLPTAGSAVAKDQDVGVFFSAFALTIRALPPQQGFRGPSIPGAGQHQIQLVISHIGKALRLCRGNIWWRRSRVQMTVNVKITFFVVLEISALTCAHAAPCPFL